MMNRYDFWALRNRLLGLIIGLVLGLYAGIALGLRIAGDAHDAKEMMTAAASIGVGWLLIDAIAWAARTVWRRMASRTHHRRRRNLVA